VLFFRHVADYDETFLVDAVEGFFIKPGLDFGLKTGGLRFIVLLLTKNQQMEKAFSKPHLGAFFAPQKTQACRGFRRLRGRSAPLQK
jgi:hypothetical protein